MVYWLNLLVAADLVHPGEIEWELSEANQLVAILSVIVFNARANSNRR